MQKDVYVVLHSRIYTQINFRAAQKHTVTMNSVAFISTKKFQNSLIFLLLYIIIRIHLNLHRSLLVNVSTKGFQFVHCSIWISNTKCDCGGLGGGGYAAKYGDYGGIWINIMHVIHVWCLLIQHRKMPFICLL